MPEQRTSRTYARALRVVAAAIAVVAIAKHLAGDFPDAQAAREMLIVRSAAAGIALVIALLSSVRRSVTQLEPLAFALGLDIALMCLGAVLVVPGELWEQTVSLVAMMFGAAVFLPWSWRWDPPPGAHTPVVPTITRVLPLPAGARAGHVR